MTLNCTRFLPTAFAAATVAGLSTVAVVAQPQAAEAACISAADCTVDYGGATYKITTTARDSFNNLQSDLIQNFWWGSESLATLVATEVGSVLGLVNDGGRTGAFFASDFNRYGGNYVSGALYFSSINSVYSGTQSAIPATSQYVFAVATVVSPNTPGVPTPTLLPALVGLGLAAYRKRKAALSAKS